MGESGDPISGDSDTNMPQSTSGIAPLNVAVIGAGAVGCYFGGMLARAGHTVTLIARPAHVDAIQAHGLRMQTKTFDEQVPVAASTEIESVQGAQLILFCVKSTDTESAALQALPHLARQAVVLSLQNGVNNGDRLRQLLPDQVVASAVVYVATEMAGPGHVKHHGRGELVVEPFAGSSAVTKALIEAGVKTEVFDNVRGALWLKLIINCAYNAISAITQLPYGKTAIGDGVQDVMRDAVSECLAVAKAQGVEVAGDPDAAVRMIFETMSGQFSSTAQDLARGKPSEIDYLNGFIVRRGEALGIATPVNRTLWSLVKLLESKQR